MDRIDRKILDVLQADGRISNQELAARVGLSTAPCWRRVKRLQASGVIRRYVTLLDPAEVGLSVLAYAHVSLENHHPHTVAQFDRLIRDQPEVLECYSMSGQNDYLVKIVTSSMAAYERLLSDHLLPIPAVRAVNTSFVLKQKKHTTALPLSVGAEP